MTTKLPIRCIHRHTKDEHPGCFFEGLVIDKRSDAEQGKEPWYMLPGMRIGYLDIEADGLKADWDTMLTWCIKQKGGDVAYDSVTREELFDGTQDRRIVESLLEEMKKYDLIVTYYGTNYDLPFIRAKSLRYDLDFPHYRFDGKKLIHELSHFDLYFLVKAKLCISRKSLDNVCQYLGIKGKTEIDKEAWRLAKYGDKESLIEVLRHNIGDVKILEELHNRLSVFAKYSQRSV